MHTRGKMRTRLDQAPTRANPARRAAKLIGSFVGNSYVSTLCPVVICPYLCTSENLYYSTFCYITLCYILCYTISLHTIT